MVSGSGLLLAKGSPMGMHLWHFDDEWASGGSGREAEQKARCAQCGEAWLAAAETVGADWWVRGEQMGHAGPNTPASEIHQLFPRHVLVSPPLPFCKHFL